MVMCRSLASLHAWRCRGVEYGLTSHSERRFPAPSSKGRIVVNQCLEFGLTFVESSVCFAEVLRTLWTLDSLGLERLRVVSVVEERERENSNSKTQG